MTQDEKQTREATATALPSAEKKETVGEELRRARLAKDQDLRDIAAYLCIRYQFLQALEDSRYKELPGEAYANGFVRTYASYLGLDPSDIITRYKQELNAQAKSERRDVKVPDEETENMTPAPKALLVSLVLLIAAYGLWQACSGTQEVVPDAVPVEAAGENITVEQGSFPLDGRLPDESENIVAEENASDVGENAAFAEGVAPVPPVPPAKPAAPVENAQPRKAEKPSDHTIRVFGQKNYKPRLVLVANEDSWVEITRGDTVLFSRLLAKGDRYQVSSNKPEELFLKTGNAGGLDVYCDGNPTRPLGPRGALRSKIALNPDDFAAKTVEAAEEFE